MFLGDRGYEIRISGIIVFSKITVQGNGKVTVHFVHGNRRLEIFEWRKLCLPFFFCHGTTKDIIQPVASRIGRIAGTEGIFCPGRKSFIVRVFGNCLRRGRSFSSVCLRNSFFGVVDVLFIDFNIRGDFLIDRGIKSDVSRLCKNNLTAGRNIACQESSREKNRQTAKQPGWFLIHSKSSSKSLNL